MELLGLSGDRSDSLAMLKRRAREDGDAKEQILAIEALAATWKDDPDTLPFLKTRAKYDWERQVRLAAVREIVKNWQDDPERYRNMGLDFSDGT